MIKPQPKASRSQPAPHPASGLAARWRQSLLDTLNLALARLDDSAQPPARRIRKSRQSTKVARALLRLAPRGLKRQALGARMALASVSKRLSPVRDTDSLLETLHLAAEAAGTGKNTLAALAKPLTRRRGAGLADEAKALSESRDILKRLIRQIESWKLPRGGAASIIEAAREDYRRLRREADGLGPATPIEQVHAVRKRAIVHRHQLAFLAGAAAQEGAQKRLLRRAERLKVLHQAIGQHRDLALLADYLATAEPGKHAAARQTLATTIARLQRRLIEVAEQQARRLTRRRPAKLARRLAAALRP